MAIDILLSEAQGLTEDALMEIVRFVKFLKAEGAGRLTECTSEDQAVQKKVRNAGKYRGQIAMSDDFDAPLEEFRGYM